MEAYQLPLDRDVAIYARQSTKTQLERNKESFKEQTKRQKQRLLSLGWAEEQIREYYGDLGKSGTIGIDGREDMLRLVTDIRNGEVGAVCVYMEDRLFRDEFMIDANIFIRECSRSNCIVITSNYVYDLTDNFERKRFRTLLEMAWDFYDIQINQRLKYHRQKAIEAGKYDGRVLPVGYQVCRDKTHKYNKKLFPYEPHARVVREMFNRVVSLGGDLNAFMHELHSQETPHFPPATEDVAKKLRLKPCPGGYRFLSPEGVYAFLRNRVYIGEWHAGSIGYVPNNHPAIVDKELFDLVQDLLDARETKTKPRYGNNHLFLYGKIEAEAPYHVTYINKSNVYRLYTYTGSRLAQAKDAPAWVSAAAIETQFVRSLLDHLENDQEYKDYATKVEEIVASEVKKKKIIEEKLKDAEELAESYELGATNKKFSEQRRDKFAEKLSKLEAEMERMRSELEAPSKVQKLATLKVLIDRMRKDWDVIPMEERKILVNQLFKKAVLKHLSAHCMSIMFFWEAWEPDEFLLIRRRPSSIAYSPEEEQIVRDGFGRLPITELLRLLPRRSYDGIISKARGLGMDNPYRVRGLGIELKYSIEDMEVLKEWGAEVPKWERLDKDDPNTSVKVLAKKTSESRLI